VPSGWFWNLTKFIKLNREDPHKLAVALREGWMDESSAQIQA
jgi:hypothetical protein